MQILEIIKDEKTVILEEWCQSIFETYPEETTNFLKNKLNRFANPVGHAVTQGVEALFKALIEESDKEEKEAALDEIVRIRSIQNFSPGQAVGFVFLLKKVVREKIAEHLQNKVDYDQLIAFESRIDRLAMSAFDVYAKCREQICEIRINETKRSYSKLLERTQCFEVEE